MTLQLLRVVYAIEFLLAILAIFAAWSEIGGQAVLDLMYWGWKFFFSISLATSIVGLSSAIAAGKKFWNLRSARWFAMVLICILGMIAVTYYYASEIDTGEQEESGTVSAIWPISSLWQTL